MGELQRKALSPVFGISRFVFKVDGYKLFFNLFLEKKILRAAVNKCCSSEMLEFCQNVALFLKRICSVCVCSGREDELLDGEEGSKGSISLQTCPSDFSQLPV